MEIGERGKSYKILQSSQMLHLRCLKIEVVPLPDPTPRGFHFEGKCSPPSGDLPFGALMEVESSETLRQLELWRDEHQFIRAELCWMISILFRMLHVMLCRYPVRHAAHNVTLHWKVPKCLWHCWRASGWRWILWTSWGQRRRQHRAPSEWRKVSSRWNLLANGMNVLECCRLFKQIS